MYDLSKIIPGMVLFLALVLYPFVDGLGKRVEAPQPVLDKDVTQEDRQDAVEEHHGHKIEWWRINHMTLLDIKKVEDYQGCLDCHDEPTTFCNTCHGYVGAGFIVADQDEDEAKETEEDLSEDSDKREDSKESEPDKDSKEPEDEDAKG